MPMKPEAIQPTVAQRVRPERHLLYARARWRWLRECILGEHPDCAECLRNGRHTLATDIHHIIAIKLGGAISDPANLEPICRSCHAKATFAGL